MVPAVPLERIFPVPTPLQDFTEGRSEIILVPEDFEALSDPAHFGKIQKARSFQETQKLRSLIIESNLKANEPHVVSLGETHKISLDPLSVWQICKYSIIQMYDDNTLWVNIALVVVVIALGALTVWACTVSVEVLLDAHQKLAEGRWIVRTYNSNGAYIGSHLYSKWDVANEYFGSICIIAIFGFVPGLAAYSLVERIIETYQKIAKDFVIAVGVEKSESSGAKSKEAAIDIISQETLSLEEMKKPNNLVIGQYAADILSVVRQALAKPLYGNGRLTHPFENRAMTQGEEEKFLSDIAKFFSIPYIRVLDCWSTNVSDERVREALVSVQGVPFDAAKKVLEKLERVTKFLSLLPEDIREKYCHEWQI